MSKKIVYGVCGIGHGHLYRQLPVIDALADQPHKLAIMAYGQALPALVNRYADDENVAVFPVAVPYYNGGRLGLDFAAAAANPANQGVDFFATNATAMAQAREFLGGRPDMCVSDYEPVSASMAYTHDAPLVTIDQQSKYLTRSPQFPRNLDGLGFQDEIERLRMMFPRAEARLACSFFMVSLPRYSSMPVTIIPPILSDQVKAMKPAPEQGTVMVYFSSQQDLRQDPADISNVFNAFPGHTFHVFAPNSERYAGPNIVPHAKGGPDFQAIMARADALVTTAGHSLLSEAMHLALPVYAVPLPVYEQRINAQIIQQGGFGLSRTAISRAGLDEFLGKVDQYRSNIADDHSILHRGCGRDYALSALKRHLS